MTDLERIIEARERDVAAAKDKRTCDDRNSAYRQGCLDCESNFPDPQAKRNLAALGPASVALARRLYKRHRPEVHAATPGACADCDALTAWAQAGGERDHA